MSAFIFFPLHFIQSTLSLSLISHRSMPNRIVGASCHSHTRYRPVAMHIMRHCDVRQIIWNCTVVPLPRTLSLSVGRQRLKIVYYLILFAQFPTNNMLTCWCSYSNNNNSNYDNNNNKDKNRIGKCCCGNKMKQDSNNKNNSNTDNDRGL